MLTIGVATVSLPVPSTGFVDTKIQNFAGVNGTGDETQLALNLKRTI
jgi:hypothetical protein